MTRTEALLILGLRQNATPDEVKAAYRKAVMASHPDRHPGDPGARERFERVTAANEYLSRRSLDTVHIDLNELLNALLKPAAKKKTRVWV